MADKPISFRAPPEYEAAYRAAADKAGIPLGRWINDTLAAALSKSVQKSLPEQRTPGRPKKPEADS
jgi:predicted HicB family RNase H-like nuclease